MLIFGRDMIQNIFLCFELVFFVIPWLILFSMDEEGVFFLKVG
jgi:hypothetical protein